MAARDARVGHDLAVAVATDLDGVIEDYTADGFSWLSDLDDGLVRHQAPPLRVAPARHHRAPSSSTQLQTSM